MTVREELQEIFRTVVDEFENEIDNLDVLMVRNVPVLRWSYQSPYVGIDAIDDVVDSTNIFLETVGEFIDDQGLITAAKVTDTDYGIIDYVYNEESLTAYQKVYAQIWAEE